MNENHETLLPETFDPATQEGTTIVPVGTYTAQITDACVAQPKSGDGYYIALTWQITEGEHEKRCVWQRITFIHSKEQAVRIGRQQFKDLCVATGIDEQVSDVEVFKFIPCSIRVGIEIDKQGLYPDKNKVSRILPYEQKPRGAYAQPAKTKAAPTAAATATTTAAKPTPAAATVRRRPGVSQSRRSPRRPATTSRTDHDDRGRDGGESSLAVVHQPTNRTNQRNRTEPNERSHEFFTESSWSRCAITRSRRSTALERHWNSGGTAALIDMATATGKSIVLAETMRRAIAADPRARLLLAVHVRELVEQDVAALESIWPDAPYGICSDGLGRRDHDQQIIFGTIQTLFRDAPLLGRRDLLLIDEVQLVPRDGDGMYLSLIDTLRGYSPDMRMVGASATCFRLDSGYLDRGDGALFERTVFSYGIKQGIEDGYLAKLSSKATTTKIDVSGVGRRGGEFIPGELERAANIVDVVEGAVAEMVEQGGTGVPGSPSAPVSIMPMPCAMPFAVMASIARPSSPKPRATSAMRSSRHFVPEIRCLTGVNVFSVGFNIPEVDLIGLLRPTCSPGLLVQQVGRGTRKAAGKTDCLILDFAGNIRRHGPVDAIRVNGRRLPLPVTCSPRHARNARS